MSTRTMLKLAAAALGVALLGVAGMACRTPHLGDDYGVRYRAAFEAQVEGRSGEEPAAMDAKDAKRVLAKHRGEEAAQDDAPAGGDSGLMLLGTAGGDVGADPGGSIVPGPIRLEAK